MRAGWQLWWAGMPVPGRVAEACRHPQGCCGKLYGHNHTPTDKRTALLSCPMLLVRACADLLPPGQAGLHAAVHGDVDHCALRQCQPG